MLLTPGSWQDGGPVIYAQNAGQASDNPRGPLGDGESQVAPSQAHHSGLVPMLPFPGYSFSAPSWLPQDPGVDTVECGYR